MDKLPDVKQLKASVHRLYPRTKRALRIIERWRATDRASLPTRSARG